ncbi:MAG: hypothetical protein AVDCRST_MAG07-3377, partial [uncultured Frankineae bacterium]
AARAVRGRPPEEGDDQHRGQPAPLAAAAEDERDRGGAQARE